jgi:hypothetical protein
MMTIIIVAIIIIITITIIMAWPFGIVAESIVDLALINPQPPTSITEQKLFPHSLIFNGTILHHWTSYKLYASIG